MPLLSFVLVAHREQAQLEECADALLTEGADEVELVFVDDASPDHSAEVLAALAERDGRIRVLRLAERAGLGPAREAGGVHATGDHLWFLHPSDRPAPGTLSAVCERLRAAAPDVLLVDHARADALGRERPGPLGGLLRRVAADGTTTLDRRPGLAAAAPRIWDKVFRRAHLEQLGVTGASAELALTWPALLAAERIAAAPAARLLRRRLPNAPREPKGTAQEMCATYEAVFAFLAAHPELPDGRRRLVLPALLRHELRELERLPPADQPAYFAALSDLWRRHRRGDEPAPAGRAQRLEARLLERGDWRGHRALRAALDQRAALARRRRTVARRGRRALGAARRRDLQRYYRARRDEPIDPDLAVFAAYWYRGYACNPRAIYERARELVPRVHGVWVVKPDAVDALPPGVDYVLPNTRAYYDAIARARYFVNNVNFPDHLVKREGTVHVMTHHGTPLKRMGLDLRATPVAGRRMDFAALMRRCARWDYSVSSNVFSTLVWERVYPTRYESLEVGYPRNDVLATAGAEEVARIRASLGIEPGRQAVLYAPTHREYQTGYVPGLDLAAVADGLGPHYVIMARLHYFYDADPHLRELHRQGRVRDVAEHPSVEELSLAADVLVTDYSSLMFDYAVLDRPIVIHAPDWDVYRALRGTYFDLLAEPPGVVARTEDELVAALRAGDVAEPERAAFRARFCALDDGRAAERVVRRVFPGARAAAPAKPVVR